MEKPVVLIVDDSVLVTQRLKEILRELTNIQNIIHASGYLEGLRMINELKPSLVLLDISLPDGSGIELLRIIRESKRPVTVIMITNNEPGYYKEVCNRLGADYFLDKTIEFEKIPAIVSEEMRKVIENGMMSD